MAQNKIKKNIKRIALSLSKKSLLLRRFFRFGVRVIDQMRYRRYVKEPVNEKEVLFEAFRGRKYADSPKAIYEYMLNSDEYKDYTFVWAFEECEKYEFLAQNERTRVVTFHSDSHLRCYATCKYWVTNSIISDAILKRENQVYVQCWHGTPLKRLAFDIQTVGANAMNTIDEWKYKYQSNSMRYTYMVSPSRYCTEKFISAFNLKEIGKDDIIIEEGYPRNDFLSTYTQEDVIKIKKDIGIPDHKKVILYAPTWRDDQHDSSIGYTYKNQVNFDILKEQLGEEYIILFRAHSFVANHFDFDQYDGFVYDVSQLDDINELYVVADILVTDYSSVLFDYANLKRPIIFYMYDLERYRDEIRGFYISTDELPGPIVQTEEEFIAAIKACDNWIYDKKYQAFNSKYNYLDDGFATERVVHKVIRTETTQ